MSKTIWTVLHTTAAFTALLTIAILVIVLGDLPFETVECMKTSNDLLICAP